MLGYFKVGFYGFQIVMGIGPKLVKVCRLIMVRANLIRPNAKNAACGIVIITNVDHEANLIKTGFSFRYGKIEIPVTITRDGYTYRISHQRFIELVGNQVRYMAGLRVMVSI